MMKSGVTAALAGLLYGGLPAARHARQRYIQVSQAELYTSRVEAVVSGTKGTVGGVFMCRVCVPVVDDCTTGIVVITQQQPKDCVLSV